MKKLKSYKGAGVALFQNRDDGVYVLLGLRDIEPKKGTWTFPGGGFDSKKDKTLEDTAYREFNEEVFYDIRTPAFKQLDKFSIIVPFFSWSTLIVEDTEKALTLSTKLSFEFSKLEWIEVSKIKDLPLHPWVSNVVQKYVRMKR